MIEIKDISRDFIAQRVYDLTHIELKLSGNRETEIWKAIAETDDDELYAFYHRLVKEKENERNGRN